MKKYKLALFVNQAFDENLSAYIVSSLLYYQKMFAKDGMYGEALTQDGYEAQICVYINSPGGYVSDLMAIIDTLGMITIPVTYYCLGQAASCGAVLFASGTKGQRFIGKNSHVLLHQVSAGMFGDIEDLQIATDQATRLNDQMLGILAKATGKSKAEIKDDIDRDLWLNAKEAIEYGIADAIIEPDAPEIKELAFLKKGDVPLFSAGPTLEMKRAGATQEEKSIVFEIKETKEDDLSFHFSGYASIFGNADGDGDIVHQGAFARTLKDLVLLDKAGDRTVLWQHDPAQPVGLATLTEDKNGLRFSASLPKDDEFVKGRVIPQLRSGSIRTMSFGFRAVDKYFKDGYRHITDVELYEISLVTIPSNKLAKITGMKNGGEKPKFENITDISRYLKEKGLSKSETDGVVFAMKTLFEPEPAPCNEAGELDQKGQEACNELLNLIHSTTATLKQQNETK